MIIKELIHLLSALDPEKEIVVMGGIVVGVTDLTDEPSPAGAGMAAIDLEYA